MLKLLLWASALVLAFVIWRFATPAQILDSSVRIRDGRILSYRETGDRAGAPVLMIHGTPGSRQLYIASDVELRQWGVRLIQVDRPGFGLSTPCEGMEFRNYGIDIEQLLDHLHIAQAGVLGWSAGTPWALALGSTLNSRVSRIGIVGALVTLPEDPAQFFQAQNFRNSKVDLDIIRRPDVARGLRLSYSDTLRNGMQPLLRSELKRIEAPWGIEWKAIRVPVRFWHGLKDAVTPPKGNRMLAERIDGAEVIETPEEGHMLIIPRAREITGWVARGSEATTVR